MTDYRHEWKIELSPLDLLILRQRLRRVLQPDTHAVDGRYLIRSLYFDTPEDRALREKIDGVSRREKFRIRYYNGDVSCIHLEKKSKIAGLGRKDMAVLQPWQAQAIVDGRLSWMAESGMPLVTELYGKMCAERLRPKTIVDYTREPFVYAPGNVRVTLDYNIRTGLSCTGLLEYRLSHDSGSGKSGDSGGQMGRVPAGRGARYRPAAGQTRGRVFQICGVPDVRLMLIEKASAFCAA